RGAAMGGARERRGRARHGAQCRDPGRQPPRRACQRGPRPHQALEAAAAPRRAAAARELALVLRLAVIDRELLAARDVAQRVDLGALRRDAEERIRLARVVDEAEAMLHARGVERVALELDDRDDALPLRAPPRLAQADHLALEL